MNRLEVLRSVVGDAGKNGFSMRQGSTSRIAAWLGPMLVGPLLFPGVVLGQAGGLYSPENGGPISGTAQAGSAAVARDAETSWLNPAGMTRLEAPEVMLGVMPFVLDFEFRPSAETTATGSSGGNQGGFVPGASLFAAVPVHERVALGLSILPSSGIVIDPDDDWAGRSWTTRSALVALNFEPAVAVEIIDELSLGAGLDVQYVRFEQDLRAPVAGTPLGIDGTSWDVGFSASLLWELLETTRLGIRYRSEVSHDLSGDLTVSGSRPVSTSFTLPMSVTFSPYHEFSEAFALMADIGWTDWSAFDRNVISFDGTGAIVELPRNFKDTWSFSLGAHFRPWESWLLMVGAGYVSSAVDDENRTPDLPVDQQVRASLGVEYRISEHWAVGGNYTFLWLGDNEIDQTRPLPGRLAGEYDAFAHIFGLYGSLRF